MKNSNNDQTEAIRENNQAKFAVLKRMNLPIDQYAIIGSGPLGIRNLREIGDIDIIVTPELWASLAEKYGITDTGSVKKIIFPGGIIEAFWQESFYSDPKDPRDPIMAERIAQADIIDGLPFDTLQNVSYYKIKGGRDKDLKDIFLIQRFLRSEF